MNKSTHRLKIIDLGSACLDKNFTFQYLQSRYYRAPEVMLGLELTNSIDMWSLGTILLELYVGIPIFPGNCGYDQIYKILEFVGFAFYIANFKVTKPRIDTCMFVQKQIFCV